MTRLVQLSEAAAPAEAPPSAGPGAAMALLLLALKALGQRFIVALANLVTLIGLGSAFWLWSIVLPAPSANQLIGLGLYGLFVLGLRWVWQFGP